ncbi:glycosyltransferase family 2 protein [Psychroserpens sp. XS_ASV72]|uniref:glycosyltransferase family 2 protein n=1 Tax=Psychroserpens sp. XS_ASV72 TaxID=3241293 RepID=UPI003518D4D2
MTSVKQKDISPLVSVVVPCYNVEQYVDKGLQSILNQSYTNWECIIVNDGSTDSTESKIKEWTKKDSRFQVVSQQNKGLSGARNTGLQHVKGDCIYFFDPDDIIDDNCLKNLTDLYHHDIDIVIGKVGYVYGQTTNVIDTVEHVSETNSVFRNTNFIELSLKEPFSVIACNKLYSANFISSNNLSFKDGILHEDELWFFQTMRLAKSIVFNSEVTYYYNIGNQNSITKNYKLSNLTSYLKVIEIIYANYYSTENNNESKLTIGTYILNFQMTVISAFFRHLKKNKNAPFKSEGIALIKTHIKNHKIEAYQHINNKKSKQFGIFIKYALNHPQVAFKLIRNVSKNNVLKAIESLFLKLRY